VKRFVFLFIQLSVYVSLHAQAVSRLQLVADHPQKSFPEQVPAGDFSGITPIGQNLYAVVDDKRGDGFYVFRIDFDAAGDILSVRNLGFRGDSLPGRDAEGIVYFPPQKTVFISGEQDNRVLEYHLNGRPAQREIIMPELFKKAEPNRGLEALAYNEHTRLFWTTTECPLPGDTAHVLCCFNHDFQLVKRVAYAMDAPTAEATEGSHVHGVSAMTALADGSLLVLEREALIPEEKFGAWANCKLYQFFPDAEAPKHLIHEWKTDISLFHQDFANYEGMCLGPRLADGSQVILLVADSQHRYMGVLSDWFKTLVVRKAEDKR
jgi:hypothetical protein